MDIKSNKLQRKLNGYQKANRNRFLLLMKGVLTQEEFLLYELGIAITDWDRDHKETYGTFVATNKELAEILGWKADSSVSRHKKSLIRKGYFKRLAEGRIRPEDFEQWQLRRKDAKFQEDSAKTQTKSAKFRDHLAKMQTEKPQKRQYPLGSSKGPLDLSDEEIERISREIESD